MFMKVTEVNNSEEKNLFFVNASGGFGKTARVRRYIAEKQNTSIWIDLDTACNEKEVLIGQIMEQIQKKQKGLYAYNTGFSFYKKKMEDDSEKSLFQKLGILREIHEMIILDNFHVLQKAEILEFIERLINQFPCFTWVLIGRKKVDFLIRYIVSGQCVVIRDKDLMLGEDEVMLEVQKQLPCSWEQAEEITHALYQYFQGWPAGIFAALRYVSKEGIAYEKIDWDDVIENSMIVGYIQQEVLRPIPKKELELLKKMALLLGFQEPLYDLFFQYSQEHDSMECLVRNYFFVMAKEDGVTMLPVFQKALRKLISREEMVHISGMVYDYYIQNHQYNLANTYALWLKDEESMELYLKQYGKILVKEGYEELWIECIFYYLKKRTELPGFLMHCMAENFIWNQNQKQDLLWEEERKTEQTFFLNLCSYNENPFVYSEYFIDYYNDQKKQKQFKPKLKVNTFGTFSVRIIQDDKELTWRTKKGCELFAFLLHMNGNPIKRNDLLDILWPNGLPKNAVTMLHNMIYNIRKELAPYGLEEIIQYKDKMYSLNMEWIESDLEEHNQHNINLDPEYFRTYPGRYLENIDGHWTINLKEFYDKRYIEACLSIANAYIKQKDYEQAIDYLRNVLQVDNLKEEAFENMLYCYGQLHERKRVHQEYQEFKAMLKKELGVEPCEKLRRMYQKIMKM